jgi:hypothetical protein
MCMSRPRSAPPPAAPAPAPPPPQPVQGAIQYSDPVKRRNRLDGGMSSSLLANLRIPKLPLGGMG